MNRYKFTGSANMQVIGYGIVKPGEVINTYMDIQNPLFEKQEVETKKVKKKLAIKSKK